MRRKFVLLFCALVFVAFSGSAGVFKLGTVPEPNPFPPEGGGGGGLTTGRGEQLKFILLVDDDGSNGWPAYYIMDVVFTQALVAAGYTGHYDVFEVPYNGDGPPDTLMAQYHTVIWFTGETWNSDFCVTLSATDEAQLASYLAGGGNLFLSAQDYFWDRYFGYGTFSVGEFPYDYLKVTSTYQDAWGALESGAAAGQSGSVADGLNYSLSNPYQYHSCLFADTLGFDTTTARGVWKITSAPNATCALQYESGLSKVVFTTLSFPGIANAANRGTFIGRIISWFLPPGFVTLADDVPIAITDSSACRYNQSAALWGVVGVRPEPGSNWDMDLYTDPLLVNWEAGSYESGNIVDFVVGDYTPSVVGWDVAILTRSSGATDAAVEFEAADSSLSLGWNPTDTTDFRWDRGDVIEMWDVELDAGEYTFTCHVDSGSADLGIALFHNPDTAAYYAGRADAFAIADDYGSGANESFTSTLPLDDVYGFVVWSNDADSAFFRIEITSSSEQAAVPTPVSPALEQNSPNPFINETAISYQLPAATTVDLQVLDISGRVVITLARGEKGAGYHEVTWDGRDSFGRTTPNGVYFCRLSAGNFSKTKKLIFLR